MRCLKCYRLLEAGQVDLHEACARSVFGTGTAPALSIPAGAQEDIARKQLGAGRGLTGVQRKFSADLDPADRRIVLSELLSGYLVKPQTPDYPNLPEVEALTMRLAELTHLDVAPSTLLRTEQGELAYITRRVDRTTDGYPLRQEDMAQITERLTEDKYRGSHEQIGRAIDTYCTSPRVELVKYFRAVAFCFVTGNNDAHLKNWSLTKQANGKWTTTPLYDQVAVRVVLSARQDPEELALPLAGRKRKLTRANFLAFAKTLGLPQTVATAQLKLLAKSVDAFEESIRSSYLPTTMRDRFVAVIHERIGRLVEK